LSKKVGKQKNGMPAGQVAVATAGFLLFLTVPAGAFAEGMEVPAAPVPAVQLEAATPSAAPEGKGADSPAEEEGEFTTFDFFVGGSNYGFVYGHFGEGWFQADNPEDFFAIMPKVRDREAFRPLFEGRISKERAIPGVGTIKVDVKKFSVDLQIDQEQTYLVKVRGDLGKLQATETIFSLYNSLWAVGSAETRAPLDMLKQYSTSHDTILSKGRSSLEFGGTIGQDNQYLLDTLTGRQGFNAGDMEWQAEGGLLTSQSNFIFARSLPYSGLHTGVSRNFLFKDELNQATNLELYLPRRSKVDVYRGSQAKGELMFSSTLDFGTVQIDTRGFRNGSYDIEIVITDDNGQVTRETRPFSKIPDLVPWSHALMDFEAGNLRNNLDTTGAPFASAFYRKRLKDWMDGSVAAVGTQDDQVVEGALRLKKIVSFFKAPAQVNSSLTMAVSGQGKPVGVKIDNVLGTGIGTFFAVAEKRYDRPEVQGKPGSLALADRESLNLKFSRSFLVYDKPLQGMFSSEFSSTKAGGSTYHYGPSFTYSLNPINGYGLGLKFDYTVTPDDKQATLSLSIGKSYPNSVWSTSGGASVNHDSSATSSSASATLAYSGSKVSSFSTEKDWSRNLDAEVSLRASPLTSTQGSPAQSVESKLKYKAKYALFNLRAEQKIQQKTGTLSGNANSAVFWNSAAGLQVTPSARFGPETSTLFLRIKGWKGAKVGVELNHQVLDRGVAGDVLIVPVPPYETSKIKIFPLDEEMAEIEGGKFEVVAFPGSSLYREVDIERVFFLSGYLIGEDGKPLPNERALIGKRVVYSDEDGWISFEAPIKADKENEILLRGGGCAFAVGQLPEDTPMIELGNIPCKRAPPEAPAPE
jgi:hypothetical protein